MGQARKHNHARRRNRVTRTTIKRDPTKLNKKHFRDSDVSKAWDFAKTALENYKALGLTDRVNAPAEIKKHAAGLLSGALGIEVQWMDLPEAEAIAQKLKESRMNPRRPADWISEDEIAYLRACIAKHGDPKGEADYVRMARDIKANWKQHSAAHLQTRIERMRRFTAAQAEAEAEAAAAAKAAPAAAGAGSSSSGSSAAAAGGAGKAAMVADDDDDDDEEEAAAAGKRSTSSRRAAEAVGGAGAASAASGASSTSARSARSRSGSSAAAAPAPADATASVGAGAGASSIATVLVPSGRGGSRPRSDSAASAASVASAASAGSRRSARLQSADAASGTGHSALPSIPEAKAPDGAAGGAGSAASVRSGRGRSQ